MGGGTLNGPISVHLRHTRLCLRWQDAGVVTNANLRVQWSDLPISYNVIEMVQIPNAGTVVVAVVAFILS